MYTLSRRLKDDWFPLNDLSTLWDDALFAPSKLSKKDFSANVYENDKEWVIEAAVPGVKKEEISVDFDNGYLEIKVEKTTEEESEKPNYYSKEISYSNCSRCFKMSQKIDLDSAKAELKDGILKLTFQKSVKQKIEIN